MFFKIISIKGVFLSFLACTFLNGSDFSRDDVLTVMRGLVQNIDDFSERIKKEYKEGDTLSDKKFFPNYSKPTSVDDKTLKAAFRSKVFLKLHPDKTSPLNGAKVFEALFKTCHEIYNFYYNTTQISINIANENQYFMTFFLGSADASKKEEKTREEAERKTANDFMEDMKTSLRIISSLKKNNLYQIFFDGDYYKNILGLDANKNTISYNGISNMDFLKSFIKQCLCVIDNKKINTNGLEIETFRKFEKKIAPLSNDLSSLHYLSYIQSELMDHSYYFDVIRREILQDKKNRDENEKKNKNATEFLQQMNNTLNFLSILKKNENIYSILVCEKYNYSILFTENPITISTLSSIIGNFVNSLISQCLLAIKDKKINTEGLDLTPIFEFQKKLNQFYSFGDSPYTNSLVKDDIEKNCKVFDDIRKDILNTRIKKPDFLKNSLDQFFEILSILKDENINLLISENFDKLIDLNFPIVDMSNRDFIKSYLNCVTNLADRNMATLDLKQKKEVKEFIYILENTETSFNPPTPDQINKLENIRKNLLIVYSNKETKDKKNNDKAKNKQNNNKITTEISKTNDVLSTLKNRGLYSTLFEHNPLENKSFRFKMKNIVSSFDSSVKFLNAVLNLIDNNLLDTSDIDTKSFRSFIENLNTISSDDLDILNSAINNFDQNQTEEEIKHIREEIVSDKKAVESGDITAEEEAKHFAQHFLKGKESHVHILTTLGDTPEKQIDELKNKIKFLKKRSLERRRLASKKRSLERSLTSPIPNKQGVAHTFCTFSQNQNIKRDSLKRKRVLFPEGSFERMQLEREISELSQIN